jgi:5-methylcytosine-specific restriction endonuclease McrA
MKDPRRTARWTVLAKRLCASATECAICGRAIPKDAPPRSRWSPAVDHLIPVALGGPAFELSNLRVVHAGCNSIRGNRQPRLRPRRKGYRPRAVRVPAEAWLGEGSK